METALTPPKNRIGPLALASIGSITCAGHPHGGFNILLEDGIHSTGSNVAWCQEFLSELDPARADDPYVLGIQHLKSLAPKMPGAAILRTDRDSLLEVKHALSLTASQLALAMGVSRSALYQWLDESKAMRPRSRDQLAILQALASQWMARAGAPISRSPWVSAAQRARLVEILTSRAGATEADASALLDELVALRPDPKPGHRSVLEIARERNWKKLPDHVRQAQWNARRPSAGRTPDPL